MSRTALVTGADRGLGLALTAGLLELGWRVLAGRYMPEWPELDRLGARYPEALDLLPLDVRSMESVAAAARMAEARGAAIDLLINNAGVISESNLRSMEEPQDYAEMLRVYDTNSLGPLRVVQAFLPATRRGKLRRLCFVSSEAGSIGRSTRTAWYGYCMSKAALNMGCRILFNHLRPEGYTFRVYHPGWVRSYMSGSKNMEATLEPEQAASYALPFFLRPREDEDRLELVDYEGQAWPW